MLNKNKLTQKNEEYRAEFTENISNFRDAFFVLSDNDNNIGTENNFNFFKEQINSKSLFISLLKEIIKGDFFYCKDMKDCQPSCDNLCRSLVQDEYFKLLIDGDDPKLTLDHKFGLLKILVQMSAYDHKGTIPSNNPDNLKVVCDKLIKHINDVHFKELDNTRKAKITEYLKEKLEVREFGAKGYHGYYP